MIFPADIDFSSGGWPALFLPAENSFVYQVVSYQENSKFGTQHYYTNILVSPRMNCPDKLSVAHIGDWF